MIDASGIDREPGMGYCSEFHKDESGCYALVVNPDGSSLWRFRNEEQTIESPPEAHSSMHRFRSEVMDNPNMMQFGWTDWRGAFSSPCVREPWMTLPDISTDPMSALVGAAIVTAPIALLAYAFWTWMGWL